MAQFILSIDIVVAVDVKLQIFTLALRFVMEPLSVAQKAVQCGLYEVLHIQRFNNVAVADLC